MNGYRVEGKLLPWGLIGLKGICRPNGDVHGRSGKLSARSEGWKRAGSLVRRSSCEVAGSSLPV